MKTVKFISATKDIKIIFWLSCVVKIECLKLQSQFSVKRRIFIDFFIEKVGKNCGKGQHFKIKIRRFVHSLPCNI